MNSPFLFLTSFFSTPHSLFNGAYKFMESDPGLNFVITQEIKKIS